LFGKGHGFVGFYGAEMTEIRFIADQHDDDVGFGVVAEFFEPAFDVFECGVFGDIVDEEGAYGTSVLKLELDQFD
jgi:hypothetical protein